ncbi:MAG: SUMF1/EgtB/PvdO family nonheme iron enzyme [Candidatus Sumerlaeota bacterium]|nr:SUMF1/EgtB/PvdO family nonheme iron enzyme [Candidatus Sumerlaeota bacterium]
MLVALAVVAGCNRQTNETAPSGAQTIKTACGADMVSIPAGEFTMGVNEGGIDVKPAHPVKVDAFLMDQCEITQEIYEKVTGKNPSRRKNPKNPVEQVTWTACVKFCNARSTQEGLTPCYDLNTWECNFAANGYRLPTEAEWEYACRAGSGSRYFFGEDAGDLKTYAWFQDNSQSKPHPVGQRKPNAFGLYDMAGNVWEWCNDFYGAKYYRTSLADNPRGPQQGEKRILRGGAWSSGADNCVSWVRNCDEAGLTDVCLTMDSNGFRCVRRK